MAIKISTWLPGAGGQKISDSTTEEKVLIKLLKEYKKPLLITGFREANCIEKVKMALESEACEDWDKKSESPVTAHITIPLAIHHAIGREELLKRVLRKIYLFMVNHGLPDVEALRPIVTASRLAYIRSMGGAFESKSDESRKEQKNAKITSSAGAEFGFSQEWAFAKSLIEKYTAISAEELEDELEEMIFSLTSLEMKTTSTPGAVDLLQKIGKDAFDGLKAVSDFLSKSGSAIKIKVTIVIHDIDKIDAEEKALGIVSCFSSLLREINSFLGYPNENLRLIVVGGADTTLTFMKEELKPDSKLAYAFQHIYIGLGTPREQKPGDNNLDQPCSYFTRTENALTFKNDILELKDRYKQARISFGNTFDMGMDSLLLNDPFIKKWLNLKNLSTESKTATNT